MKNYVVLQDGLKECGSACLLSIIRYYGGDISLDKIIELTSTTKKGTSFYMLQIAAKELGLLSKGYKITDINKLIEIKKPFISQVVIKNYTHFVVIYKFKNNKITLMDPAKGMVNISLNEFKNIYTGNILILEPFKPLPIFKSSNYVINIIKTILYNNKKIIINLILLTLMIMIFTGLYSYHFKIIIDYVIDTNSLNLLVITIIFLIIFTIKISLEYLRSNLLMYFNQKIDLSIITTTINKIISLPYSYYKNKTTGEMISRINDLFSIKNVISKLIIIFFLDFFLIIGTFLILFRINKNMTLILLIITIFYFFIFLIYKSSIKNITYTIQEDNSNLNSILVESISSYETIKGLTLEKNFISKINSLYLKYINSNLLLSKTINQEEFLKNFFEGIFLLLCIYLGSKYIMDKTLTIGTMITYNTLIYYFITPTKDFFNFYKEFIYTKNSIKRINNLLNIKYEKLDKKSNLLVMGSINIRNLSFSYNQQKNILNNISLSIQRGDKVLILGPSGSGKSTLLKILYKYYNINRGMIYIDDYDFLDFTIRDIRENITYVSQNELLYTNTIKNNVILDREISAEEFLHVCRLTYVEDILKDNLLSYDFVLEENGANISGGQRQRIILARSLLKNTPIIMLDEALNEIDITLERKILKNIFIYYYNKTIIIVSHRHDNMDLYDKVINIENGSLKEVKVKRA